MKYKMNIDKRILLILATLVAVAVLATFWATREPLGSPPEGQVRERWDFTEERMKEIRQLMEDLRKNGTSWNVVKTAVDAKLGEWNIRPRPFTDIELYYTVRTVVSTINIALVIILLLTYIDIYRKTRSNFTVGLIMFSIILLFYTVASNPIMQWASGFRAFGLGPFAMLPDLFACVALSVLLYLSLRY